MDTLVNLIPTISLDPVSICFAAIITLVVVIMLSCTLAAFTTRKPDDNGLRYEGTYKSRFSR
jgi:hypothetical protein